MQFITGRTKLTFNMRFICCQTNDRSSVMTRMFIDTATISEQELSGSVMQKPERVRDLHHAPPTSQGSRRRPVGTLEDATNISGGVLIRKIGPGRPGRE